jgi:hypothetical protein
MKPRVAPWLAGAALLAAAAVAHAEIRFYNMNRQGQQSQIMFVPRAGEPGCHNFPVARDVHRVAQVRFEYCSVYAERNCAAGSEYPGRWDGRREPVTQFTPGSRWVLEREGHVKVRSWNCVAEGG